MGDSTLDSESFVLRDRWPEAPMLTIGDLPAGGLMDITQQNVATPAYELGTKLLLWNNGTALGADGWSILIYLKAELSGPHTGLAKQVFVHDANTAMFLVTPDPDDELACDGTPLIGISLSVMVDTYYGWFWCGGQSPESHCVGMDGTYLCVDTLTAGPFTLSDLTADNFGFNIVDADTEGIIGYAFAAAGS